MTDKRRVGRFIFQVMFPSPFNVGAVLVSIVRSYLELWQPVMAFYQPRFTDMLEAL